MVNGTVPNMRETTFGKLISQYAPDELHLFDNLRVFIDDTGNFWFIGKEVAAVMGYSNTRDAILRHVPEQYKMISVVNRDANGPGPYGSPNPEIVLISELGLYALAMGSRLPQAFQFQDWVYRVISRIRQYGGYIASDKVIPAVVIPDNLRPYIDNMIETKNRVIESQQQIIENMKPKVDWYDRGMNSEFVVPITMIAKDFGMSANELHIILNELKIIYKIRDSWVLYKAYQDQGYTASKSKTNIMDIYGVVHEQVEIATYWTEKGREFIHNTMIANGHLPLYMIK